MHVHWRTQSLKCSLNYFEKKNTIFIDRWLKNVDTQQDLPPKKTWDNVLHYLFFLSKRWRAASLWLTSLLASFLFGYALLPKPPLWPGVIYLRQRPLLICWHVILLQNALKKTLTQPYLQRELSLFFFISLSPFYVAAATSFNSSGCLTLDWYWLNLSKLAASQHSSLSLSLSLSKKKQLPPSHSLFTHSHSTN